MATGCLSVSLPLRRHCNLEIVDWQLGSLNDNSILDRQLLVCLFSRMRYKFTGALIIYTCPIDSVHVINIKRAVSGRKLLVGLLLE